MNLYRIVNADDFFYAQKLTIFGWGSMTSSGNVWCDNWKYDTLMTGHDKVEGAMNRLIKYANKKRNPLVSRKPKSLDVVTQFKNKKAIKEFAKDWGGEW